MKILPIIETIEVTKSKKDNIHCLFLKFNSKFFGIDNHQYNIDFDENGLGRFELDITSIWTQYEYPHYDIHKSKEEIFIYFYEYPHKENEVEFLNSEVKNVGFFPKKSA
jgi:hypothetical protein